MLTDNDVQMLLQAASLNAGSKMATIHTKQLLEALKELYIHRQNAKNTLTFVDTDQVQWAPNQALQLMTTDGPKGNVGVCCYIVPDYFVFDDVKVGDRFFERSLKRTYTVTGLTEKGFKYDVDPPYHAHPARMGPSLVKNGELFIKNSQLPRDYWNSNFEKIS